MLLFFVDFVPSSKVFYRKESWFNRTPPAPPSLDPHMNILLEFDERIENLIFDHIRLAFGNLMAIITFVSSRFKLPCWKMYMLYMYFAII